MKATVTIILAGAHTGHTKTIRGVNFVDGKATLHGTLENLSGLIKYLAAYHEAYLSGSDELKKAQERDQKSGKFSIQSSKRNGQATAILGGDGSTGETSTTQTTNDELRNDETKTGADEGLSKGDRESPTVEQLRAVLLSLDHANGSHWTMGGRPSIPVVEEILGMKITRAQMQEAVPNLRRILK